MSKEKINDDYKSKKISEHDKLVIMASKWLRSRSNIVITEMAGNNEEPDAIGFKNSYETILIECKISRSDFLADSKKYFRREPERGIGVYRYYLVPKGLIKKEEIKNGWGLLEVRNSNGYVKKIMNSKRFMPRNIKAEMSLLISSIRRFGGNNIIGVSAKVYQYETKNKTTIGILVKED